MFRSAQELNDVCLHIMGFYDETFTVPVSEMITMLLGVSFVELVQKTWRRYLGTKLLEQNEDLSKYINMSAEVSISSEFRNSILRMGDRSTAHQCNVCLSICTVFEFTFAICCRPSVCRLSVVCLSSICL